MLECFEVLNSSAPAEANLSVELVFEQRQKSRAKAVTNSGEEVAWFLSRGRVLADGDYLLAASGDKIKVVAADECVSEIHSNDYFLLMRAAYHLGNRHVPLQIGFTGSDNSTSGKYSGEGFLRYQHDHVLDDMVCGLGLSVSVEQKPFHPEPGAYHSDSSSHNHDHEHQHDHGHHHHD